MIKIFISSTFSDMQSERDIIRNIVLPNLKVNLIKKGYDVSITDLRWGITNETTDSNDVMTKILSVCADEIKYCEPYFVLLVGNRYGTLPNYETLEKFTNKYRELLLEELKDKSITELETKYALKLIDSSSNLASKIIVLNRDSSFLEHVPSEYKKIYIEDEEKTNKLEIFKNNILNNKNVDVINYHVKWDNENNMVTELDSFASELTNKLLESINKNINDSYLSLEEEAEIVDDAILRKYISSSVLRTDYLPELDNFMNSDNDILIIKGDSGSGKTAFVAQASNKLSNNNLVLTLFLGNGLYASTTENILINIVSRLNKEIIDDEALNKRNNAIINNKPSIDDLKHLTNLLIKKISEHKQIIIILDNVSSLQYEELTLLFSNIPLPSKELQFKLIVSISSDYHLPVNHLIFHKYTTLEIGNMSEKLNHEMINKLLLNEGKELDKKSLNTFYSISFNKSPLYVSLILNRLVTMSQRDFNLVNELSISNKLDGSEALSLYITNLINNLPDNELDLFKILVKHYSQTFGYDNYLLLLAIIVNANEQLRINDIYEILKTMCGDKYTLLDIINIIRLSNEILTLNEITGRVKFSHSTMKKYIQENCCNINNNLDNIIFDYLNTLNNDDPVRLRLYFLYALKTSNYKNVIEYIEYVNSNNSNHYSKYKYQELNNIINDDSQRTIVFDKINSLINYYTNGNVYTNEESNRCLKIFAQEYNDEIYFIFNKLAVLHPEIELITLRNLYDAVYEKLYKETKNYENYRLIYTLCEKCGISSSTHNARNRYYLEFFNLVEELLNNINKSFPNYEYICSDYAYAHQKIASQIFESTNNYVKSIQIYDEGISFLNNMMKTYKSSKVQNDMFEYQMNTFIIDKYKIVCNKMEFENQINFISEVTSKYSKQLLKDINESIKFFNEAINKFNQDERVMCLKDYLWKLTDCYLLLAKYYICVEPNKGDDYLLKAVNLAYECYKIDGSLLSYDKIRLIEFLLGSSKFLIKEERLNYLIKSNQKTKDILKCDLPSDKRKMYVDLLNDINGYLLKLTVESLYENATNRELLEETANLINNKIKGFNKNNVSNTINMLMLYLKEVDNPFNAKLFSYTEDTSKLIANMNTLIYFTSKEVIVYKLVEIQDLFKRAYSFLEYNIYKAKQSYEELLNNNLNLMEFFKLITDKYNNLYNFKEVVGFISDIADLLGTSIHNLSIIYDKLKIKEKIYALEIKLQAQAKYYEVLKNTYSLNYNYQEKHKYALPNIYVLHDLYLFVYLINKDNVNKLYSEIYNRSIIRHWYNSYQELVNLNDKEILNLFDVAGKYLCESFDNLDTKRIVYHSIFYEAIALEYAYKNNNKALAKKIIDSGFDYYLELDTLYIIRKYDRKYYYSLFNNLKVICLSRCIDNAFGYNRYVYGDIFCDEVITLSKKALQKIDHSNPNNPLLKNKRNTPDWAINK